MERAGLEITAWDANEAVEAALKIKDYFDFDKINDLPIMKATLFIDGGGKYEFTGNLIGDCAKIYKILEKHKPFVYPLDTHDAAAKEYKSLIIEAKDTRTNIWVGDMFGFLVQKEVGVMKTKLAKGRYKVHFGLDGVPKLFDLQEDLVIKE